MEVGREILRQLGGARFVAMTGAKNFLYTDNSISFRIGKNAKRVNYVKIELTHRDDYTMTFGNIRGLNYTVKAERDVIFADSLRAVFEAETGMATRLF